MRGMRRQGIKESEVAQNVCALFFSFSSSVLILPHLGTDQKSKKIHKTKRQKKAK
jgi:hypothetical protein